MGEFLSAELVGIMVVDVTESLPVVSIHSGILTAALDLSGFIQLLCDLSAGTGISAAPLIKKLFSRPPSAFRMQHTAQVSCPVKTTEQIFSSAVIRSLALRPSETGSFQGI